MKKSMFVQKKFAEYYQNFSIGIQPPHFFKNREFGFILFKKRIMLRHKGFRNIEDLRSFLKAVAPSDVFYSSAYYDKPEAEMDSKGWIGADLIFDIDADHIPTPCEKNHDLWICRNCGTTGRGISKECPTCGEQKIKEITWPCDICLASAKAETIKLIDLLMMDFGFSTKEIGVAFSGHRGYHLCVESGEISELDVLARKEIVDYIGGTGLDISSNGLEDRGSRLLAGPDLNDPGWRGRIAKGTYDFLLTSSNEKLKKIGLKKKAANLITEHKNALLESWRNKGPWSMMDIESWRKIVQKGVEKQSVKIDTVVTTDLHRLLRFTDTLHGKTGLKKTKVSIKDIDSFDPFKSAVAFKKGSKKVFVFEAPQFRMEDELYGPYKNVEVELPTSAALLLLCKELARIVE